MRKINYIVIHCTATTQSATVDSIMKYWREKMGWKSPGYHYLISADGMVHNLHPEEKNSNGVRGHNHETINVCYVGGIDAQGNPVDNRTEAQREALIEVAQKLIIKYPQAQIQGHRDFPNVAKACPCFDAKKEYKMI